MDHVIVQTIAPLIGILIVAIVVSIPLIGFTLRYAAKPLVEAFSQFKLAQSQGQVTDQAVLLHDRRLSLLEAEVQQIQASLRQLVEAEEFRKQLEPGREQATL
jgi:hypothetical protein